MKKIFIAIFILIYNQIIAQNALSPYEIIGNTLIYKSEKIELNEYNILVDGNLNNKKIKEQKFIYNDINEAFKNIKSGKDDKHRMTIYVSPYVYWINNKDGDEIKFLDNSSILTIGTEIKHSWITICGLTDDASEVIIANDKGKNEGAQDNYAVLSFKGKGIKLQNITLGNYCNVDLEYKLKPELNHEHRSQTMTQAQIAIAEGDCFEAHNVRFIGRLKACPLNGAKRTLFNKCYFEMSDDALCGSCVFLDCKFALYGTRPFNYTSVTGAAMLNCDFYIRHDINIQYLTRKESPITLIDCRFHAAKDINIAWTASPSFELRCYKSNVTLNGKSINIQSDKVSSTIDITDKKILNAYKYTIEGKTIYNTYNLLSGNDQWDPMNTRDITMRAETALSTQLTNISTFIELTASNDAVTFGGKEISIKSNEKLFGGYKAKDSNIVWNFSRNGVLDISKHTENTISVKSTNTTDFQHKVTVIASNNDGLQGTISITSKPQMLPEPSFAENHLPQIVSLPYGCRVDYQLNLENYVDQSIITWYRCDNKNGDNAIPISVSRNGKPEISYLYQPGDEGKYIKVAIRPKHIRSEAGELFETISNFKVDKEQIISDVFYTDFSNFPTENQTQIIDGHWTINSTVANNDSSSWSYGQNTNNALGLGLMPNGYGSYLLYTPSEKQSDNIDMTIDIDLFKQIENLDESDPKYIDICIKFDTKQLIGYGLRIARSPYNDKYIDCALIEYRDGQVNILTGTKSIASYYTTNHIHIWTKKYAMYADIITDKKNYSKDYKLSSKSIHLGATITPNNNNGIGLLFTDFYEPDHAAVLKYMYIRWHK